MPFDDGSLFHIHTKSGQFEFYLHDEDSRWHSQKLPVAFSQKPQTAWIDRNYILEFDTQFDAISARFIYNTLVGERTGLYRLAEPFVENILPKYGNFKITVHAKQVAKPRIKSCAAWQELIWRVVEACKLTAGLLEADLGAQLIVANIICLLHQPVKAAFGV